MRHVIGLLIYCSCEGHSRTVRLKRLIVAGLTFPLILVATGIAQAADAYNHITYGRSGSGPAAFRGNINIVDWNLDSYPDILLGESRLLKGLAGKLPATPGTGPCVIYGQNTRIPPKRR